MNHPKWERLLLLLILSAGFFLVPLSSAFAGPKTEVGPYVVEVVTSPNVIPVGRAELQVKITEKATGKPVKGATVRALTKMPSMDMGERELAGTPAAQTPGIYRVPAQFAMEGGYDATIRIKSPLGEATAHVPLQTGQNTSSGAATNASLSPLAVILTLAVLAGFLFIILRVRRTGQTVEMRALLNPQILGSLLLLGAITAGAFWAVRHLRRPGALTPVDAQAMDMSYLPPPPGFAPVELATVTRGSLTRTVRYTGTAVGFVEQDIYPRVTGNLVFMPLYAGDRVRKGQVIARLDTTQTAPQTAEKQAAATTAAEGISVALAQAEQAKADVGQAHAELAGKQGSLTETQAGIRAAREEKNSAGAALTATEAQGEDARAQVTAARADQTYWKAQIARSAALLQAGAVSGEEFQRDKAQADTADAKVTGAQARVSQVEAEARSAQAALRRSDAQIAAAQARVAMARSELGAHYAHVRSAEAAVSTATMRVGQARSGAAQARAGAAAAAATQGYAEIRADVDGVVTQRLISPGVLVSPGQALLRIAQVNPIRLQANAAESDLAGIRVGSVVQISGREETRKPLDARVTSVSPSVDPAARTAVVEAVVPNGNGRFVPGQFVVMDIGTGTRTTALRVPTRALRYRSPSSEAILAAASQPYLWVADTSGQEGQFTARRVDVQTGITNGTTTEILAGVKEGERVVVSGGADLKEGDIVADITIPDKGDTKAVAAETLAKSTAKVTVTAQGFEPGTLTLPANSPARIVFTRTTNQTCATDVVFPDYGIKKALPLNQPVTVEFTPKKGEIRFACGMNMVKGKVVAQ